MSRDYEFDARLKNHELGNQNIYRLRYVSYQRIGEGYIKLKNNVEKMDWTLDPFMLPLGMSREEAFRVLSYLIDYIEQNLSLPECSFPGLKALNDVLDLERLGFKKVPNKETIPDADIIDLFTVTGRILLFKKSKNYKKYFDWYTEGVTLEEVKAIYQKLGLEFSDLKPEEKLSEIKTRKRKLSTIKLS